MISVIVPVYNAEKYISRCIDSILSQTFTEFEILLIDDGSPDGSGAICDEYSQKDSRVRVIHKENGGVSSARQCGIDHAQGEYIIHADPDDWIEPTMLEELYRKAVEDSADMVICDYWEDFNEECRKKVQSPLSLKKNDLLNDLLCQRLHGSCCNKLISNRCYKNVQFPIGLNYSEDTYVIMHIIAAGIKVTYLPKAFYHYCLDTNPSSIMKGPKTKLYYQGLDFIERIKVLCPVSLFQEGYSVQYADLAIRAFCCNIYSTRELVQIIKTWELEYHFEGNLSLQWKLLLFLSVDLRMYKFFISLIELKRKLRQ